MGPGSAWKFIQIPFDVPKVFGSRARVSVQGTVNGFPFRSSIFPDGKGGFILMVNKTMRQGGRIEEGKAFRVEMEKAGAPPKMKLPNELSDALRSNSQAKEIFSKMTYACRKEYAQWIDEAKQPATRERRATQAIEQIRAKLRAR